MQTPKCMQITDDQNRIPVNMESHDKADFILSKRLEDRLEAYSYLERVTSISKLVEFQNIERFLNETTAVGQLAALKCIRRICLDGGLSGVQITRAIKGVSKIYGCSVHSESRACVIELVACLKKSPHGILNQLIVSCLHDLDKPGLAKGLVARQLVGVFEIVDGVFKRHSLCPAGFYDSAISSVANCLLKNQSDPCHLKNYFLTFIKSVLVFSKEHTLENLGLHPAHLCHKDVQTCRTARSRPIPTVRVGCATSWKDKCDALSLLDNDPRHLPELLNLIKTESTLVPVYCEACKAIQRCAIGSSLASEFLCVLIFKLKKTNSICHTQATRDTISVIAQTVSVNAEIVAKLQTVGCELIMWLFGVLKFDQLAVRISVLPLLFKVASNTNDVICVLKNMMADCALDGSATEFLVALENQLKLLPIKRRQLVEKGLEIEPTSVDCSKKKIVMKAGTSLESKGKREFGENKKPWPPQTGSLCVQELTIQLECILEDPQMANWLMHAKISESVSVWRNFICENPESWKFVTDVLFKWIVWGIVYKMKPARNMLVELVDLCIEESTTEREVEIVLPTLIRYSFTQTIMHILKKHSRLGISIVCKYISGDVPKPEPVLQILKNFLTKQASVYWPSQIKREIAKTVVHVLSSQEPSRIVALTLYDFLTDQNTEFQTMFATLIKRDPSLKMYMAENKRSITMTSHLADSLNVVPKEKSEEEISNIF